MSKDLTILPSLNSKDPRNIFVSNMLETGGNVVKSYLAAYPEKEKSALLSLEAHQLLKDPYVQDLIHHLNQIDVKTLVPKAAIIQGLMQQIEKAQNSKHASKAAIDALALLAKITGLDKPAIEQQQDNVVYVLGGDFANPSAWEKEAIEGTQFSE